MLINTAILFLRELLPLCLLFAYLLAILPNVFARKAFNLALMLACLLVPFVFFSMAETVSDALAGKGAELLGICLLLAQLVCFLVASTSYVSTSSRAILVWVGVTSLASFKGSSLILYLDIYLQQSVNWQPLLVGALIGTGICLSILVLLKFLLTELISHQQQKWVLLLWVLFLVGNTLEISNLLLQINAVEWGAQTLFDISNVIADSSEYGYLLNALLGFESSPTLLFLSLYAAFFCAAMILLWRSNMLLTNNDQSSSSRLSERKTERWI
jgi:high-affinity iron transporter